jgi:acetyl esterase
VQRWLEMIVARQPLRRIALDAGMHAAAALAERLPRVRHRMAACRRIEDVEYAGVPLRLDILAPARPGPHPVLIYLHGGAFAILSKRTHRAIAAAYVAQGYLVCNVDYRLAPQHPFPAAVEDACAAWSWAADHVGEFGGDREHMALAGESAGANLALAVTLACCSRRPEPFAAPLFARGLRPRAALLYYGFLQTSMPERYRQSGASALATRIAIDAARSYLGASAGRPGPEHALADPLLVVEAMEADPGLPPIFIAAGLDDPVAPDSRRLDDALTRLRSPRTSHFYPGETHGFHVMFWRAQSAQCWRDSFAFLQQYCR